MPKKLIFIIIAVFLVGVFLAFQGYAFKSWNFKDLFSSNKTKKMVLSAATVNNNSDSDVVLKAGTRLVAESGNLYYLAKDVVLPAGESTVVSLESDLGNKGEAAQDILSLTMPDLKQNEGQIIYITGNTASLIPLSAAVARGGNETQVASEFSAPAINFNFNVNQEELAQTLQDLEQEKNKVLATVSSTKETLDKISELQRQYQATRTWWQKILDFLKKLWEMVKNVK